MSRSHHSAKGPTQRQLRAGEVIRHALVDILQREELRDEALVNISVTISEVRVSPDLKNASCFAAPLGGGNQADVVAGLNRLSSYLRGLLGKKIDLKHTPTLKFLSDDTFMEAERIDRILTTPKVAQDLTAPDDDAQS